ERAGGQQCLGSRAHRVGEWLPFCQYHYLKSLPRMNSKARSLGLSG
ncbi:MAG: hypothetical protein RL315_504, partial [Actinomycetota bacterium]